MGAPGASEESAARRMVERTRLRGPDHTQCWSGEDGVLGVCRAEWELGRDFAGGVMVLDQHPLVVAADATLYYKDDLRRALQSAGVHPAGDSPSHLIAAAYQAWGVALVDQLEGDYAFILWDRQHRLLLAARDFAGTRPLHFARAGDRVVVGSSLTAVAAHSAVPRDLNRLTLAEDLIGAASMVVRETAFLAVERLPAGFRLLWRPGSAPQVERFWEVPPFDRGEGPDSREAAEQLRELLRAAVRERLATEGPTTVWMSGGYDSPAVFALAQVASRQAGRGPVVPVSMSYPVGDPGREDEFIEAIGHQLGTAIHWVRIGDVPGMPDAWVWAGRRDEAFAHPYEAWNRALAAGTREAGARVALSGNGGDQFFGVSPVFLADLLRGGQWGELLREARAIGFRRKHLRELFHWAIQPALPPGLMDLARRVRGRPLRAHLQTPVPAWMSLDRATREALWERQWQYRHRRPGESFGSAEAAWYLQASFGQRIVSVVATLVQQSGAEVRSPMYDRRVLEFMARRPRTDRYARGEAKGLLRMAMRELLPAEHLARRPSRTGLPSSYLERARQAALPRWADAVGGGLRLAALGLVQPADLCTAQARYLGNPRWEGRLGGELFNVYSAEFWLRAHAGLPDTGAALVA